MRRLFKDRIERRRLGATEENIQRILLVMDAAEGPIDDQCSDVLAIDVMARLQEANADAWCEAKKAKFDFNGLLEFISKIIEMLMPFIIKQRTTS